MFLITELDFEKNKTYFLTKEKKFFSTNKGSISLDEIKKLWYWWIFHLENKKYLICKPTLQDYIMYWLKRQTQIIYPQDAIQIGNVLGLKSWDLVFESWIWSWALSLIMLNFGVKLTSFEKRKEFIELASSNIKRREEFVWCRFDHKIYNKDIINDNFDKFENYFEKGILDIKEVWKAFKNVCKILKKWSILVIWVPTVNQVIEVLKIYSENFFVDKIYTLNLNEWIRVPERLRLEDWQAWSRGFIIKMIKILN